MPTATIDTTPITGERIGWRPARPGESGYICDSVILGKTWAWFADQGNLFLVPNRVLEQMAQNLHEVDALAKDGNIIPAVRAFLAKDQGAVPEVSWPISHQPPERSTTTVTIDDTSTGHSLHTETTVYGPGMAKNLAEGLEKIPHFEEALRDTTRGHKSIAEQYQFTSETSVRRWRAKEGVVLP